MSSGKLKADKWDVSDVEIDKFTYHWTIKNFNMLSKEKLESPVFSFKSMKEVNWYITLYPQGSSKEDEGYLSLYLNWNKCIKNINFRLSLVKGEEKRDSMGTSLIMLSSHSIGRGYPKFTKRDKLLNEANVFLPNNCLTISCEIFVMGKLTSISKFKEQKLRNSESSYLGKLFLEEHFSDLKLITNSCDKRLPAHRSLLAACSPVFEAMFKNDMLEQKMGVVKIEDGEYEVVKEMLRFIYLGKVENESIMSELLKLAHKYQIADLIQLCGETLSKQISIDNVFNIITLADYYNIDDLKATAIKFAKTNINDVVKSDDFKSLKYNQAAIQCVLEAFAEK